MAQEKNKIDELNRLCDVADSELKNLERQLLTIIAHKKSSSVLGSKMMMSQAKSSLEGLENMELISGKLPEAMKKIEALHNEIQSLYEKPEVRSTIK